MTYALLNGQPIKAKEVIDKIKPDKRAAPQAPNKPEDQTITPAELDAFMNERNLNPKKISKIELDNIPNNMKFRKAQRLIEIKEKYKDKVRFNFHFAVYELMMAEKPISDPPVLMAAAQTLGLDSESFEKSL